MIDTSTWKEFCVGDLFHIEPAKGKNQQELIEGDDVPYIAASKENNGFNRMVSVEGHEDWVSKGNCLQFVHIGDAAAGHVNYIPNDFIGMSGKSSCAYNDKLNEYNGLFIASIIVHTNNGKYSFKDSWTGSKVSDTIIKLPATPDGQPDWTYMESYMKSIMEESEKSLENLKKADSTKHLIDTSEWGEFRVGDLFEVSRPSSRSSQKYEKGDMPFVASGNFNNGVTAYLQPKNDDDFDEGDCITVSAVDGYAFYQKDKFLGRGGAGSSIMMLRNDNLNEINGKYICTLIRKACSDWEYSNMGNKDKLADTMIWLPITSDNKPDWQYMENYMKQLKNICEHSITLFQTAHIDN